MVMHAFDKRRRSSCSLPARCASDSERTKPAAALPPAAGADDVVLTGGQPATETSCLLAPDATPRTKKPVAGVYCLL